MDLGNLRLAGRELIQFYSQFVPILETALQTYNLRNEEAFSQQKRLEEICNVSGFPRQSSWDRR